MTTPGNEPTLAECELARDLYESVLDATTSQDGRALLARAFAGQRARFQDVATELSEACAVALANSQGEGLTVEQRDKGFGRAVGLGDAAERIRQVAG